MVLPHELPGLVIGGDVKVKVLLKTAAVGVAGLAIFLAVLEGGTYLLYPLVRDGALNTADLRGRLNTEPGTALGMGDVFETPRQLEFQILHPYFGFVMDPRVQLEQAGTIRRPYSAFGFLDDPPPMEPQDDEVVIAISGGSVAAGFRHLGSPTLRERLAEHPRFRGKKIRFKCFGLGGYKQPQQLLVLSYFLVRGAHFDIWINLDGFNELAMPLSENYPAGVAIDFPRQWQTFARRGLSTKEVELRLNLRAAQAGKQRLRHVFNQPVLIRSAFWLALWEALDARQAQRISHALDTLQRATRNPSLSPEQAGPAFTLPPKSDEEAVAQAVNTWARSSKQMARLCAANGIEYLHFVQPNQYFPGTKPLSDEERARFYVEGAYSAAAQKGYAALTAAATELAAEGYPVYDLSTIFQDETRTMYNDSCCHLNQTGNRILANRIADELIELLDTAEERNVPDSGSP